MSQKRRAEGKAVTRRPKRPDSGRRRWKTALKAFVVMCLVGALIALGGFVVLYQAIDIPEPNEAFQAQTTFVYYDDGETELGTYYAEQNRESIPISEMPESVQDAVVAAENETFWTDRGIDPKGILRALLTNTTQGTTHGASTITQQYVKILYLTSERTWKRKVKEAIVSLKLVQQKSKTEVLEGYLNTIYFGRGAYGIQAAAQSFFNKDATDLNLRESAALAAILNNPARFEPASGKENRRALKQRYQYVLNQMAEMETITPETRDRAKKRLPKFPRIEVQSQYGGQRGHMLALVKEELLAKGIVTEDQIDGGGLRITTTFTEKAMRAAKDGVDAMRPTKQSDADLHMAAASVEPGTGALRGFFSGQDYLDSQINWARAGGMAGSTLKPFAVATGLQEGFSLRDTFDGNSPYLLPDGTDIENQGNASYGRVSLVTATKSSINTAFIDLTLAMEDGPEKIIDTLAAAGIPRDTDKGKWGIPQRTPGLRPVTGVALGNSTVSPINMANAYATIANSGERADVHVVERVVDSSGEELYRHDPSTDQTIEADVAADTIYAMQEVMTSSGTGARTVGLGRPAIGKTGTATRGDGGVSSSWFAGATPQLATAVMMVRGDGNGSLSEITDDGGLWVGDSFAGGYYPAMAWTEIMTAALDGEEVLEFPDPVFLDGDAPSSGHDYVPPTTSKPKPTKTKTSKPTPKDPDPTTPDPTTPDPTTPDPTDPDPTDPDPTDPDPTTPDPTTPTTPTTPSPTGGGGGSGGAGGGGSTGDLSSHRSLLGAVLAARPWWIGLIGG